VRAKLDEYLLSRVCLHRRIIEDNFHQKQKKQCFIKKTFFQAKQAMFNKRLTFKPFQQQQLQLSVEHELLHCTRAIAVSLSPGIKCVRSA
jgi:hypothetical protein